MHRLVAWRKGGNLMLTLFGFGLMPWAYLPSTLAWCTVMTDNPSARLARAWVREMQR